MLFAGGGDQLLDLCVKEEVDAVDVGILRHGDVEHERTDNAAGRRVEGRDHILGQVGLLLQRLLAVQDLQALDAVGDAAVIQFLETVLL